MALQPNLTTLRIFKLILQSPARHHTAYSVGKTLGVSVQTGYDHMLKLERHGIMQSELESGDTAMIGRPLRRYYRFTADGRDYATRTMTLLQVSSL